MREEFRKLLCAALSGRVPLLDGQVAALELHCELMLKWNQRINLTSITRLAEIVERHYAESVFAGSLLPEGPISVVDVGSGAGFPGYPIAVIRPEAAVTLVESHQRKAVFLKEASRGQGNVVVRACRAEQVEGEFDWLVSRAVSGVDLSAVLRLGRSALLLSGAEEPPGGSGWQWETIPMPWGRQRWIRLGRRV